MQQIASGTRSSNGKTPAACLAGNVGRLFDEPAQIIRAHELLEMGYAAIGEIAHRHQLNQRLEAIDQTDGSTALCRPCPPPMRARTLMQLLALELPGLGIQSCYLAVYDEKGDFPAWARLILASVGRERLPLAPAACVTPRASSCRPACCRATGGCRTTSRPCISGMNRSGW